MHFITLASPYDSDVAIKKMDGSRAIVTLEIESAEHLQTLLPLIKQEVLNCNFIELKVLNPLKIAEEQLDILRNFGAILIEYKTHILLLWQDNFVCPAQNGIELTHYEWWRWNKLNLGVNPENGAKWKIESVELYLFVNDEQPETIFEVVESSYEDPAYIEFIINKLECQGFPRPRDSYNYPIYPGMPEWAQLPNTAARRAVCEIPENILETMSTQAVLQSLWEHPFLYELMVGSGLEMLNYYMSENNACKTLIERTDGGVALLYRLLTLDPLPPQLMTEPISFEVLMCYMTLLDQLPDEHKKQLIRITMANDSLRQINDISFKNGIMEWSCMLDRGAS
jgi:hypothetical protein